MKKEAEQCSQAWGNSSTQMWISCLCSSPGSAPGTAICPCAMSVIAEYTQLLGGKSSLWWAQWLLGVTVFSSGTRLPRASGSELWVGEQASSIILGASWYRGPQWFLLLCSTLSFTPRCCYSPKRHWSGACDMGVSTCKCFEAHLCFGSLKGDLPGVSVPRCERKQHQVPAACSCFPGVSIFSDLWFSLWPREKPDC